MIIIIPMLFTLIWIFGLGNAYIAFTLVVLILSLVNKFSHVVRKRAVLLYVLSILLGFLAYLLKSIGLVNVIYSGTIGFALFVVVMFGSDLRMGRLNQLAKKVMSIRGELSIIGFILITPHALDHLFFDLDVLGLIAYVIMVPLFVTSFKLIRVEISPKDWKRLHKISYAAYLFIYVHIMWVSEPMNTYVYIAIATIYFYNKFLQLKGEIGRAHV